MRSAASAANADAVYMTSVCDGWSLLGATDGYYIGQPRALMPILSRYHDLPSPLLDAPGSQEVDDYESALARAVVRAGRRKLHSQMVFFKIRNSGAVVWQGLTFQYGQALPEWAADPAMAFPMLPGGTRTFSRTREEAEALALRAYPWWSWCRSGFALQPSPFILCALAPDR